MRWALLTAALLVALAGCGSSHGLELTPELEQLLALINEQRAEGYECASGYQPPWVRSPPTDASTGRRRCTRRTWTRRAC
ncbi:hypothetical protein [Oceanithermus sp.]|uniref:hypothetical protein n=1 Tax=Oceanithermus sp. TaxID=2268145 RepID=UPI0025F4E81E|nr:hypothetical protein [Oceanithermus sp.]